MAMLVPVSKPIVGVDVAKNELVIYRAELDLLESIPNTKAAIKQWLKALPGKVAIAIEATNIYHLEFADLAYEAGCTIYMVGISRTKVMTFIRGPHHLRCTANF